MRGTGWGRSLARFSTTVMKTCASGIPTLRGHRRLALILAASTLGTTSLLAATSSSPDLPLIPYPRSVKPGQGMLRVPAHALITCDHPADRFAAQLLAGEIARTAGYSAQIAGSEKPAAFVLARTGTAEADAILRGAGIDFPKEARLEGYVLVVTPRQAAVVGDSDAGIFYGIQTLRQLLHPDGHSLLVPAVTITDWPATRWRGSQVSLSQGPVPTLSSLERTVTLLAEYKQNILMLYFENSFDYRGLPLVATPGGAMTPDEARALVAFAKPYHITIIPQQESLGHMHWILRREHYQNLVEMPYGNVLSPGTPGNMDLVRKMFDELAQDFPGPFLHMGADEPFELGQGRSKALIASKGKGQVYVDELKLREQVLRPLGRRILFWGDIAQQYPDLLTQLPHDLIAMPWNYKNSDPAQFDRMIAPFRDAGIETWVAPGVDNWNQIFPNYSVALPNIRGFAESGHRMGSTGIVNTTWVDDGESLFDFSWYGLLYGAEAAWQDSVNDAQFSNAWDWAFYRAPGHHFEHQIEQLSEIHRVLHTVVPYDASDRLMWHDPFTSDGQQLYLSLAPVASQIRMLAEDVIEDLRSSRSLAARNQDLLDFVEFGATRFEYLGEKAAYTRYIDDLYREAQTEAATNPADASDKLERIYLSDGLLLDLRNDNTYLRNRYRDLWLAGNLPYFMDAMLQHYQHENDEISCEVDRLQSLDSHLNAARSLPPLVSDSTASIPAH
ncbi:MAG: beta-N-acetylhexosaminidase [Acidobacteriota bacterium]